MFTFVLLLRLVNVKVCYGNSLFGLASSPTKTKVYRYLTNEKKYGLVVRHQRQNGLRSRGQLSRTAPKRPPSLTLNLARLSWEESNLTAMWWCVVITVLGLGTLFGRLSLPRLCAIGVLGNIVIIW